MAKIGVRGVEAYNERIKRAKEKGESLKRTVQTGFDRETGKPIYEDEVLELESMPFIVVVVDEMADLMMISRQGDRRRGAAPRADGARRRYPSDRGDAAPLGRRHHRHDQGELPDPHFVSGDQQDRQPHHPGRTGRRTAARPGRHALHDGGRAHPPRARAVCHRFRSRRRGAVPEIARPAGISRRRHRRTRGKTATIPTACSAAMAAAAATICSTRPSPSPRANASARCRTFSGVCRSATTARRASSSAWKKRTWCRAQPQGRARSLAAGRPIAAG